MFALRGTYQNGEIKFDEEYSSDKPVKVIVIFLEDETKEKGLSYDDFSFAKSQKALEDCKDSFSDAVIEERRSYL